MTKLNIRKFLKPLLGGLAAAGMAACTPTENPANSSEIRVGLVDAFTGPQATFSLSTRTGIDMAIQQVNKAGGVRGKKIRLIPADDSGKPAESAAAVTKLITKDKVAAILGASGSSRSLRMAEVAQKAEVPMITPSSTNPSVTEVGNYIFRVCFIDTFQGPVMARFAKETLKVKKVAMLYDTESKYSAGLAEFFKKKWVQLGGQVVPDQVYHAGDVDFQQQLKAIKAESPDLIYIPGFYTDVTNVVKQARALGIEATFAGGDGWDSNELYDIGGESEMASYFTTHYSANSRDPVHLKFAADYRKEFNRDPNAYGALGYDAAMVLLEAMKRSKDLSGPELRNAIASTKNFPGVTGKISIDEKRNAVKSAVIIKVQGKKTVFLQSVAP